MSRDAPNPAPPARSRRPRSPATRPLAPAPAAPEPEDAGAAVPESALHAMPGHLVRRLQQVHIALFSEECAAHGLTSVQFAALVAIEENPGIDATRLSAIIVFDRSTIGDVLERVEARGLIARLPGKADRRIKLLQLTPAGSAVLAAVRPAVALVQERLLAPLPAAERTRFRDLLTQLVDLHREAPDKPR